MATDVRDGLHAFGSVETVEILNPNLGNSAGGIAKTNDAVAKAPLGVLYRQGGSVYRYVKFDNGSGNVASAAGGVAHWKTLTPSTGVWTVTSDATDQISVNAVAGIFGGVVTDQYFTWIQVGGLALSVLCGASTVAGDVLVGGSTDLTFTRIAADASVTQNIYGIAASNLATGKANVLLQNLAG